MDEDGTGGTATVGHGLSQAPELVIGKPFDAGITGGLVLIIKLLGNPYEVRY